MSYTFEGNSCDAGSQKQDLLAAIELSVLEALDCSCISQFGSFETFSDWFDVVLAYDMMDMQDENGETLCPEMLARVYDKLMGEVLKPRHS